LILFARRELLGAYPDEQGEPLARQSVFFANLSEERRGAIVFLDGWHCT
jgi:hypothetical protein